MQTNNELFYIGPSSVHGKVIYADKNGRLKVKKDRRFAERPTNAFILTPEDVQELLGTKI